VLARDDQVKSLTEQLAELKQRMRERSDRADELHGHLREAAVEGNAKAGEIASLKDTVVSLEVAVAAKDEQMELVRSRLKAGGSASKGAKAQGGAEPSLAAAVEALSEEVRVKDEQVALLRQSLSVMEEEMLAKEGRAGATEEKHGRLQRECAARDEQIMVLSERLQAAQLEIKIGGSHLGRRNEELTQELQAAQAALAAAQRHGRDPAAAAALTTPTFSRDAAAEERFFHNTCLLVKVLLSAQTKVKLNNIPIDELHRDVVAKALPCDAWPQFVYEKFTG